MTATPNSRQDKLSYPENGGDAFQKHDERMKKFRLSHPRVEREEPADAKPKLSLILLPLVEPGRYLPN